MITVRRLESGYWHIRGRGPCNWAQPDRWPCSEETLRRAAFPHASEDFIRDAMLAATHRIIDLAPNLERQWMIDHIDDVVAACRAAAGRGTLKP